MGEQRTYGLFSEPTLTIVTINIEGITYNKQEILADLCRTHRCDILCIQETHRNLTAHRPKIDGMQLVIEQPSAKHGSAILVRNDISVTSAEKTYHNEIEVLTIEVGKFTVTSVYKPPGKDFVFTPPGNFTSQQTKFVLGDFNSHSVLWGYQSTDKNGDSVEGWAEQESLALIHDPKLPHSFQSKIWKKGYNPDLIFTSTAIENRCVKKVYRPIPRTQHRPIGISVYSDLKTPKIPFKRRFNFKKADWAEYANQLDIKVQNLAATPKNYDTFVECVKSISRKYIPRGCRQHYISGLNDEAKDIISQYTEQYNLDPFSENTIEMGEKLQQLLSASRQKRWSETLEKMDMTHSSKQAWNTIKKLSGDPTEIKQPCAVRPDQVAHQLLVNGKTNKCRASKINRRPEIETDLLMDPFTIEELEKGINCMKNGKSPGVDEMLTEQVKHFGPKTKTWLLDLYNNCKNTYQIPKSWRKSKVIALLKPGKDPELPSSYRPISLLCHLYKLYERLILNRIQDYLDPKLIPQQAGFRPGKSCTGQILNITEFIEDGFERKEMTGVALIDLTAAYDTINHKTLLTKTYNTLMDYNLTKIVESLLCNRRYYVVLNGKKSRWRTQRNGLPQGSVLAPSLFNIYTNDQPIHPQAEHFIYADDLGIAVQARTHEQLENKLEKALKMMSNYYKQNSLKPNPTKTQVTAFHLNTRLADKKLNVTWEGQALEHTDKPKYLGVVLDRSLTYKYHCQNTRQKVTSRNNLLKKLAGSKWGANPNVLRTTAEALSFSTAEYACPVWGRSRHAKDVTTALNDTCRIVTGCMRAAPLPLLYKAAGFASPEDRRDSAQYQERFKQKFDDRHPLYQLEEPHEPSRLRSRRRFMRSVNIEPPENCPLDQEPSQGMELEWRTWRMLNRMRTGVAPVKSNLAKWGIIANDDVLCECGEVQNMTHLTTCELCPSTCTLDDLWLANNEAVDVARFWAERL